MKRDEFDTILRDGGYINSQYQCHFCRHPRRSGRQRDARNCLTTAETKYLPQSVNMDGGAGVNADGNGKVR